MIEIWILETQRMFPLSRGQTTNLSHFILFFCELYKEFIVVLHEINNAVANGPDCRSIIYASTGWLCGLQGVLANHWHLGSHSVESGRAWMTLTALDVVWLSGLIHLFGVLRESSAAPVERQMVPASVEGGLRDMRRITYEVLQFGKEALAGGTTQPCDPCRIWRIDSSIYMFICVFGAL